MQYKYKIRSKLFLLAHEVMQKEPESPISSYVVAIWYLFTKKYEYALSRGWIRYTSECPPNARRLISPCIAKRLSSIHVTHRRGLPSLMLLPLKESMIKLLRLTRLVRNSFS